MPAIGYALVLSSAVGIIVSAFLKFRKDRRLAQLLAPLAAVALILGAVFHFMPPSASVISKGAESDQTFLTSVAAIYACILIGMAAEAAYNWLDKPRTARRKSRFDWGAAVKPLFVSPIILVPTIGAFQNASIDLMQLDFPRLMILLTAFEKGFLWRHYYRTRAKAAETSANDTIRSAKQRSKA